jgi:hypothetical protein
MAGRLFTYCKELVGVYTNSTETDTETDTDSSANSIRSTNSPDAEAATDVKLDDNKTTTTAYTKDDIDALVKHDGLDIASGIEPNTADKGAGHTTYLAELAKLEAELAIAEAQLAEARVADSPESKVADSSDAKAATDVKPDGNKITTTAYNKDDVDALAKLVSLAIASGIEPDTAYKAAADAMYLAEKAGLNAEKGWIARLEAKLVTSEAKVADSPEAKVADSSEAKVADSSEAKVADSSEAKVAVSPDAKAVTDVKPEDNGTAATAASNDDAKVEQVNLDIASGPQQESTTQADIEAGQVAELARLEAKLATSDARLIGLAANLAWADCLIFKKEQEHLRLHEKLSSLHEAYSKRYEELTKQNQELERVVEESQPGTAADMALLLLYLSRAAVDIAGTAKQDAEKFLRRADQQWEAYKQGYPLDDERDTSDAEGAE